MKELLGKRIKELRTQKRLTQEQLAEMVDMGERNLSKIECGVNFVSAETLEKITKALSVTAKDIFDFDHLKDKSILKTELLNAISQDEIDIDLLYRIYQSIKK
jgi:transcriptional regulator with XRE-family HTH domain